MATLRVGVFGMSQEAMLATPGELDARTVLVSRGTEILDGDLWVARGVVAGLREDPDVEIVPLLVVRCRASAAFGMEFYSACKEELLQLLRDAGKLDGLVAANHGAMEVHGLEVSGDTDLLAAIRGVVGAEMPITMALDMHGHLSPGLLRDAQGFAVFRTAPHRDDDGTGYRAAKQMLRILRAGARPRTAAVHVPLFLPGEMAMTEHEPMRRLYAALPEMETLPGVIGADYMIGFAWNDRPWIGATAVVTCDGDGARAEALAQALAGRLWEARAEFGLRMVHLPVAEGLQRAAGIVRDTGGPVFVSDSGDNVTAGAYGDLTLVLRQAMAMPELGEVAVLNIIAPEMVAACHAAGVGAEVTLALGAEHVSRPAMAGTVRAVVEGVGEALVASSAAHVRGASSPWAVVRMGHVRASFHARRLSITTPEQCEAIGIDPRAAGIFVFKVGYLHPMLEDVGAPHVLLLSDGTGALDLRQLEYRQIRRPAYPFDADMAWAPAQGLYTDGAGWRRGGHD